MNHTVELDPGRDLGHEKNPGLSDNYPNKQLENPWRKLRDVELSWQERVDLAPEALWDEMEEWDDVIPRRPTLRPVLTEFEDLVQCVGVNFEYEDE